MSGGTRLPKDWTPGNFLWECEKGLSMLEADKELDKFHDYFSDPTLADSYAKKKAWNATWRNWIRKAVKAKANKRSGLSSKTQAMLKATEGW